MLRPKIIIFGIIIGVIILAVGFGILSILPQDLRYFIEKSPLQECSRAPENIVECSEGYICYESRSGGLGPPGVEIVNEYIGGDKLCHQECETNNDCPSDRPFCVSTGRTTEDYVERFSLCFADEKSQ